MATYCCMPVMTAPHLMNIRIRPVIIFIIRIVEVVLFASIILHVLQAIIITRDNAKARPIKYAVPTSHAGSSWFARNMGITGSIIFFFIVIHLYNFFLPYRISVAS